MVRHHDSPHPRYRCVDRHRGRGICRHRPRVRRRRQSRLPGKPRRGRSVYHRRSPRQQAIPRALHQRRSPRRRQKGEPLPSGTVITLIQYAAKLDAQGNPEKDANGRFIKGNLIGYMVMEKRTGWGTEYPDNIRNGEWEYQALKADKSPNTAANLTACFNCHKPLGAGPDYMFSYDRMKAASR